MGTTLTGTTPQDTYDSLIKVTDNGPLSGTAKYLSDGLGNDSVLALSTSRVGVGTSSPAYTLDTRGISAVFNAGLDGITQPTLYLGHPSYTTTYLNKISTSVSAAAGSQVMQFSVGNGASTYADVMTLNGLGNVGIGTSTASRLLTLKNNAGATNGISFQSLATTGEIAAIECNQTLDTIDFEMYSAFAGNGFRFLTGTTLVERARFTANGLTFNGDTAAANALDDYEEGTFTMTATPSTSGTITLNPSNNTARYTKIGRQVTIQAFVTLSAVSSPVGTSVILGGLPFTIANTNVAAGSGSVAWADASASYVRSVLPSIFFANTTLLYASIDASTIASPDELFINMTYTV